MLSTRGWPEDYLQRYATSSTGQIYKTPVFAYTLPCDVAVGAISDLVEKAQGAEKKWASSQAKRLNRSESFLAASYSAGCVCGTLLKRPALALQVLRATIRGIALRRSSAGIESIFASALQTAWSSLTVDEVALAIRTWERSVRPSKWMSEHGLVVVDGVHRTLRFAMGPQACAFSLDGKLEDALIGLATGQENAFGIGSRLNPSGGGFGGPLVDGVGPLEGSNDPLGGNGALNGLQGLLGGDGLGGAIDGGLNGGPFYGMGMPGPSGPEAMGGVEDAGQWIQGIGKGVYTVGKTTFDNAGGAGPWAPAVGAGGAAVFVGGGVIYIVGLGVEFIGSGDDKPPEDTAPPPPPDEHGGTSPPGGTPPPAPGGVTPPPPSSDGGTPPPPPSGSGGAGSLPGEEEGGSPNWEPGDNGDTVGPMANPGALPRVKGHSAGSQAHFPKSDETYFDPEWGVIRPNYSKATFGALAYLGPGVGAMILSRPDGTLLLR